MQLQENILSFYNNEDFKVLAAVGTLVGHTRKIVPIACYIAPNYPVPRANACMNYIAGIIIKGTLT